jgi:hypothetical protein
MGKAYTKGNIVYIPIYREETGEPCGEAKVAIEDQHLAIHEPWYFDEHGVYAVVKVLGADVQIYQHDLVGARHFGVRVVSGGILLPEEPEASSRRRRLDACRRR